MSTIDHTQMSAQILPKGHAPLAFPKEHAKPAPPAATVTIGTGGNVFGEPTTLTATPDFEAPDLDAAFNAAIGLSGPLAVFGDTWKPSLGTLTGVSASEDGVSKPLNGDFDVDLDSFDSGFGQLSKFQFADSLHGLVDGANSYVPLFDTNAKQGELNDGVIAYDHTFGLPAELKVGALIKAKGASQAIASAKALSAGEAGAFAVINKPMKLPITADGKGGGSVDQFWVSPITSHKEFSTRLGPQHSSGPLNLEGDGAPRVNFKDFASNLVAIVDGNVLAVHHQQLPAAG